jgi:hypothetical protein
MLPGEWVEGVTAGVGRGATGLAFERPGAQPAVYTESL